MFNKYVMQKKKLLILYSKTEEKKGYIKIFYLINY